MILLITHKEDYTVDIVVNKLNKNNIPYFRLNCEDLDKIQYAIHFDKNLQFLLNGINSFNSVWFRRTKVPALDIVDETERRFIANDYYTLLNNLYFLINAKKWLSHPIYVYQAENKLYQLQKATSIGFNIPSTLITNDHSKLKTFIQQHNNNVIIKPIDNGRIIGKKGLKFMFTNKLNIEHISHIDGFDLTPSIFQNYIDKKYEIRATVVDNEVFAAKVESQLDNETSIDWRRKKLKFSPYELPNHVKEKCRQLVKELHLSFGAIDLIRSTDGSYIFLEINPNGQWGWIENDTGLPISDAIIKFLDDK